MLFNSLQFLVFFTVVVIVYFLIPHRFRWILLLAGSYYFYMCWKPEYIILILASTSINYYAALQMGKSGLRGKRKKFLVLGITASLGVLFFFKYFNFFSESIKVFFNYFNILYDMPIFKVLLPVGISFYTFQCMGYTIDVYRGQKKPEKHFGMFALYVAFFPQLVAGPIERASRLLPQFYKKIDFDYQRVTDGLKLMAWGFFKKLVIADNVAVVVNRVYNHIYNYSGPHYLIATVLFAVQIYADFSGYSDIAIGAAQVLGIQLMENFRRPYFAKSISEFWQRWHISLSTWLRDYLFLPTAYAVMRRIPSEKALKIRADAWGYGGGILITMFLGGLWHGAKWTFVLWGLILGFFMIFSRVTRKPRKKIVKLLRLKKIPKLYKTMQVFCTFCLICFSWIFFRANSISDALHIVKHIHAGVLDFVDKMLYALLFNPWMSPHISPLRELLTELKIKSYDFFVIIFALLTLITVHLVQRRGSIRNMLKEKPLWYRWGIYYFILFSIYLFGNFNIREFLYFQF